MTAPLPKPFRSDPGADSVASAGLPHGNAVPPGGSAVHRRKPSRSEPEDELEPVEYQDSHDQEQQRLQVLKGGEEVRGRSCCHEVDGAEESEFRWTVSEESAYLGITDAFKLKQALTAEIAFGNSHFSHYLGRRVCLEVASGCALNFAGRG